MKALGLLVNLTQDGEETESLMVDHGAALLGILVSLLQDDSSEEKSDQVVCLLVNLSGCSVEKVKDILAGCDDLMRAAARILVSLLHCKLPLVFLLLLPPPLSPSLSLSLLLFFLPPTLSLSFPLSLSVHAQLAAIKQAHRITDGSVSIGEEPRRHLSARLGLVSLAS
jgi:hypothetical protein